jgi:hypothetical protein
MFHRRHLRLHSLQEKLQQKEERSLMLRKASLSSSRRYLVNALNIHSWPKEWRIDGYFGAMNPPTRMS